MKYCIGDTVVCINVEEQNLHSNFRHSDVMKAKNRN